jgi:hypothetical protein
MKYLLQIYAAADESAGYSAQEEEAIVGEYLAIRRARGVIAGDQLQPVETATTVRIQDGTTLLIDGPFVDAKEHLGGYLLVEADDLDAALEIAVRIPAARIGRRGRGAAVGGEVGAARAGLPRRVGPCPGHHGPLSRRL